MKFFDYKFMLILGLSMVVYFIYREIEQINKRVSSLENNSMNPIKEINKVNKQIVLPLPEPPQQDLISIPIYVDTYDRNYNKPRSNDDKLMGTVEEYSNEVLVYSNEVLIYSNDMSDSTNEQDTLMVESIVGMTKNIDTQLENKSSLDNLSEGTPIDQGFHERDNNSETNNNSKEDNILSEETNTSHSSKSNKSREDNILPHNITDESIPSTIDINISVEPILLDQSPPTNNLEIEENNSIVDQVSFEYNNIYSYNNLVRKKIGELHEIANSEHISILVDGTNKKKTKIQLAQEIFNKKNI